MVVLASTLLVGLSAFLGPASRGIVASRCGACVMETPGGVFRTPKSTDTAVLDQAARASAAGMSPQEYEEATRRAGNEWLATKGAHVGESTPGAPPQRAGFMKQL